MAKQPVTELKDKKILNNPMGEEMFLFLLVKKVEVKVARNNNDYLDMVVCDKNNILNVKKFDLTEEERSIKPGEIIKIRGEIQSYNDAPQLKIIQFRRAKEGEYPLEELVPSADRNGDDMYQEIARYINDIEDNDCRTLVKTLYEENKEALLVSAAALHMHHMVRSGLLLHIVTMARQAIATCQNYKLLNKDLLMTGVLLHDIGKLRELKMEATGLAEDFTREGKLLGHLQIGFDMVSEECKKMNMDKEKMQHILHMMVSHHGEPEFGSAVVPITPEAQVLHYIDLLDSKMYAYQYALAEVKPGEFTDKVYALKNKNICQLVF